MTRHMNVIMYRGYKHLVITPDDNKGQSNILDTFIVVKMDIAGRREILVSYF